MRAERDEDEFGHARPERKQQGRRMAYEIALGIVLGGCVLMTIMDVKNWVAARMVADEIRVTIGR